MRIVISGASGFIGSALARHLTQNGHEIRSLVRRPARSPNEISWAVENGTIESAKLEGLDAAIHLAGEPIDQRWNDDVRRRILDSRVQGTKLLAESFARLQGRPRVMLSGSAMGIYGSRGDEWLDESSTLGPDGDYLAYVCKQWEAAAAPASDSGIRVVFMRTGLPLSKRGGALGKMLIPFKLGVGGRLGSGDQWMSWIALDDYVELAAFCLEQESMNGPVNFAGPAPVTNADFTSALGRALGRPTVFPVPRIALKLLLGDGADATAFASQRLRPARALGAGFSFRYTTIDAALERALRD